MSNPATKAPNFTLNNAREMAERSVRVRRENAKRESEAFEAGKLAALASVPNDEETRRKETLRQIDALDRRINEAIDEDDEPRFLKLAIIKDKLWKLVQPTGGVSKPGRSRPAPPPVPQDPATSSRNLG